MPGAKQGYHALPAALVFFLLFFASLPMPGSQRSAAAAATFAPAGRTRDGQRQPPAGDRKILLELLLNAVGDSSSSRQRAFAPSLDRGGLVRRYGSSRSGALSSSVSREWVAGQVPPRLVAAAASRHVEVFPRDSNLKDKFIKHFTGPVTFSAECSKHFHRLYHNTRDCLTPAYYKRCARLLTRLAISPLCTQS